MDVPKSMNSAYHPPRQYSPFSFRNSYFEGSNQSNKAVLAVLDLL